MAVGIDFLSKTKLGGMKDIMGPKTAGNQQATGNVTNSIFANNKAQKQEPKADVANMKTADLLNYVYNNGMKNNDIKLPATVEFNNQKFPTDGNKFDDVVADICKQTGESQAKVETELKKKYITAGGAQTGGSLNMNA